MRYFKLLSTLAALTVCSAILASQTPSGHALFEQALAKERVEGNLPEAIKLYERVVTEFVSDRALAAQALVQVGLCYEKLGRDEAVRAYERLVRDFADQEDAVEVARLRLATLKQPEPVATAAAATPAVRAFPRVDNLNPVLEISPDGTKVAGYNFDKGQNLAVYDVASQQTTHLTDFNWTPDSSWVLFPAWSPDGRRIAYSLCANRPGSVCELRTASLAGVFNVIFRTEPGGIVSPVGWLPDDSALVVALGRADKTVSIGVVPTAGGPFTQLRSISSGTGLRDGQAVSLSPDGQFIAFVESSPGDIHVISRDGRTAHRITDHPADDYQPVWSPDGRHLAFQSNRGGIAALWTVALRDGHPAAEPVRVKEGMQDAHVLGWTTRGLVYWQDRQTNDIYTVPVDSASGEPNGSPRMIPYRRTGHNVAPEWSPDGRYLAFESSTDLDRSVERRVIVVLPSDGGESREFPIPSPTRVWGLRWFGDSSGLGFTGFGARGEPAVFRLTLATGAWKTSPLAAPNPNTTRIEWNADGTRYYYSPHSFAGEATAIIERDLQSDRERIVFRGDMRGNLNGYSIHALRFSPDRRWLAMNDNPSAAQQGRIVVLDVETGKTPFVYGPAGGETFPLDTLTWAPGGRALLVRTRAADRRATELRRIPLDGAEARRIALGPELTRLLSAGRGTPAPSILNVSWSPDGSRLAFGLNASQRETWVIENPLAGAANASARK